MEHAAALWITADYQLGESIIWHEATQKLYWVDLLKPALFVHDPINATTVRKVLPLPPPIGSIAATTDPKRLMLAHRGGLSLLHVHTDALESFCDPEQGRDDIIYNDIKSDRWGRLWVGTSHVREQEPRGALWCVKDRQTWALGDAGFPVSNGPAFSCDGGTLLFNDSAGRKTFAYDINESSLAPRNRRILRGYSEEEGMPDGIVVDSQDTIWSAQWNGAALLATSANGLPMHRIDVPAYNVTTLCFAGADLQDVYITSATDGVSNETMARYPMTGSLFKWRSPTPGLAEPLFAL